MYMGEIHHSYLLKYVLLAGGGNIRFDHRITAWLVNSYTHSKCKRRDV